MSYLKKFGTKLALCSTREPIGCFWLEILGTTSPLGVSLPMQIRISSPSNGGFELVLTYGFWQYGPLSSTFQ